MWNSIFPNANLERLENSYITVDPNPLEEKLYEAKEVIRTWECQVVKYYYSFLTDHQRHILDQIILNELRPTEVAKSMKLHTTAIFNSLYGIYNKEKDKFYGGSLKKLKELLEKSEEYQGIIYIKRLVNNDPDETLLDYIINQEGKNFSLLLVKAIKSIE
jgi:predicted DNA-binding protein YlxM (UPF0122 family)